jgi:hypothetical protein
MYVVLLGTFIVSLSSCSEDDDPVENNFGTITGIVSDDTRKPISGVDVTVSGINEEDVSVTTGDDGKYTVENVSLKTHAVSFSKTGWLTTSVTVTPEKFGDNKVATADISMVNASAKITGTITDAKNAGAPLSDVTISLEGTTITATSGGDGKFVIEDLIVDD